MSIEFLCGGCSHRLRVADESAGKQARCPKCGQISRVPAASPAALTASPLADSSGTPQQSPFAPQDSTTGVNPYQSPRDIDIGVSPVSSPYARWYGELGLASRGNRLAGAILDGLIHLLGCALLAVPGGFIGYLIEPNSEDAIIGLGMLAGIIGLFIVQIINWVLIAQSGQSIAKRMLGMRIVTLDGRLPGFVNGVILRIWIPFAINQACNAFGLVDALWIFGDERRCLHDLIASTRVIDVRTESRSRPADLAGKPFRLP